MNDKDLAAWLTHFETLHPVGIDMGLDRVASVWQTLCRTFAIQKVAQKAVISVSGTNGKGSACQMLTLLLSATAQKGQSHRVGTYTSPHIHHFRERVSINQQAVDDACLIRAFVAIERARGAMTLSYFEATTLVGLLVFAWQKVDYAVLEVGLGGRLDAINIIDADAVLITSVAQDHAAFLGHDLSQIAVEKTAIARPHKPAVYAQSNVYDSVIDYADVNEIALYSRDYDYRLETQADGTKALLFLDKHYPIPSQIAALGEHQTANLCGVLVLLAILDLVPPHYETILADFSVPGRLQVIAEQPTVMVDVAHNEAAALALADYIRKQTQKEKRYAVIGMLCDKDHAAVLSAVNGLFEKVFFANTEGERGYPATALQTLWRDLSSTPAEACLSFTQALAAAKKVATEDDVIYAFGSFLTAEALI